MSDNGGAHQYRRRVDPQGNDSLSAIVRRIRPGSRVLELGVATGYLSRYLSEELGCLVDGAEIDPVMAREARPWCNRLLLGDLERESLGDHFPRGFYDYVIAADVLEHLVDPGKVLRQFPKLLAGGGRLIVSLPNSAYAGLILELLSGELRYRDEGLLDRTHLRFFTETSARRLLHDHGFMVEEAEPVCLPFQHSEFHALFGSLDSGLVERVVAQRPDADVYQYVLSAVPTVEPQPHPGPVVDVVVPVYGGFELTRRCLESVLAFRQAIPHEVVVIDDASPEPQLAAWLDSLAAAGRITLVRNSVNRGFPSCANLGLSLHPERDVVLLNSDAEVHDDWLDRLAACAQSGGQVGTVTPFTNSGTICAYPRFFAENRLPAGWDLARLDALFRRHNRHRSVELPTAVGFCTYIRRPCIERTGLFDVAAFGRGYGEEVDFCRRASAAGFSHLLCADTFVYHAGGGSFGAEAEQLQERAQQILNERYPDYVPLVEAHRHRDPARWFRRLVDLGRLRECGKPVILFVIHYGGGGTEQHARELAELLSDDCEVLFLRPTELGKVRLEWPRTGEEMALYFDLPEELATLQEVLQAIGVVRIHFHHLLGHVPALQNLPRELQLPYDYTVHDYYPICPQYQMTDPFGRYCGEPDVAVCERCVSDRPAQWGLDIVSWRRRFADFLSGAERVIVPSSDAQARLRRYFDIPNILVLPHPEKINVPRSVRLGHKVQGPVKVLVLGRLTPEKGAYLLRDCVLAAHSRGVPMHFHLLGYSTVPLAQGPDMPLSVSGEYRHEELPRLIELERADLIFFPALWPETYSYTLSAAINSALPIAAPDLGAFPERLKDYPSALLQAWDTTAEDWIVSLLEFATAASTTGD